MKHDWIQLGNIIRYEWPTETKNISHKNLHKYVLDITMFIQMKIKLCFHILDGQHIIAMVK